MNIARRELITLLGGVAAAWPISVRAQQGGPMRRVGMLMAGGETDSLSQHNATVFRTELAKLGWAEGRNLQTDVRFVGDDVEAIHARAAEIATFMPDVVLAETGRATNAMHEQAPMTPIVYTGPSPETLLIKNIARPEGNITGFPILYPSMAGKWVELLKEAAPHVTRIALIWRNLDYLPFVEAAAATLGVKVDAATTQDAAEIERTVGAFATEPNGALIVMPSAVSAAYANRNLIRRLTEMHRLPAIHWDDAYPANGGLMAYGSNTEDLQRRAAAYVDRLLRGTKVSELPIERPTKFELVINLKAAKAIGLTIPEGFLLRADRLIEQ